MSSAISFYTIITTYMVSGIYVSISKIHISFKSNVKVVVTIVTCEVTMIG